MSHRVDDVFVTRVVVVWADDDDDVCVCVSVRERVCFRA